MAGKKRAFFSLLLVFFLLIVASGCTFGKGAEDEGWKDDILYAEECGLDGLPCCKSADKPECQFGQVCCVDPNGAARNQCVDECGCGGEGQYCCADNLCGEGLACHQGQCKFCGSAGQPCCLDKICNDSLVCHNEICLMCGLANSPCCSEGEECINQSRRDNIRTECRRGVCAECGFDQKEICENDPACNEGTIKNNTFCLACGGFNQPCCNNPDSGELFCSDNLTCDIGFCN